MPVLLQNDKTKNTSTFKISKSKNLNLLRHVRETRIFEGSEVIIFDCYENYRSFDIT